MTRARWPRAPKAQAGEQAERTPRAPVKRGTWRCCGANGCGETIDGTWASAERHADQHGGARLEVVPNGPARQAR